YLLLTFFFFFFKYPSTSNFSTLSLHDALPISLTFDCVEYNRFRTVIIIEIAYDHLASVLVFLAPFPACLSGDVSIDNRRVLILKDRKSTRLNSSHVAISYAVFCLKKKRTQRAK